MNTTHPEAKPRAEHERDDTIWQWCPANGKFAVTTANGTLIALGLTKETAGRLCREHNRSVLD